MKTITIAAMLASETVARYKEDGETIHSAIVLVNVTTGYGDKQITAQVNCTAYGKAAEDLLNLATDYVIVTGDVELPKGELMHINNAKFYPGSPGLMLNQMSVVGNVGNEPEVMRFERGMVAKGSLAARRTKGITDWFSFEVWGRQGETIEKYVGKGSQIALAGQLKLEQWNEKQSGDLRTAYRLNADRVTLLGSKRSQETGSSNIADDDDF